MRSSPLLPTAIPADRVVIVIDVGDSPLAPHQTVKKHLYYYRTGGRSEPAPHFFLELLWGRQNKYPGQKVARAWLDLITGALTQLQYQDEHLGRETRAWDRLDRYETRLTHLVSSHPTFFANLEQFLEFYPDVAALVERHRKEVSEVWKAMETLFDALVEQRLSLMQVYKKTMSSASRKQLFEEVRRKGVSSPSEKDLTDAFFGSFGPDHNISILAINIVNHNGALAEDQMFAPLWNVHRESFMAILSRPPFKRMEDVISRARMHLRRTVSELSELLKEKRRELAFKFGEPYQSSQ